MHVGKHLDPGQRLELRPGELLHRVHQRLRKDGEIPRRRVERRDVAVLQDGPLAGEGLPRGDAVRPPGVRADDGVVGHGCYSSVRAATRFSTSSGSNLPSHLATSRPCLSNRNTSGGPSTCHLPCHTSALSVKITLRNAARWRVRNARAASRASASSGGSTLTDTTASPRRLNFWCMATSAGNFSLHAAQNVPQTSTRTTWPLRAL